MAGQSEESIEVRPPRLRPLWKVYEDGRLKAMYGIESRADGSRRARLYAWVGKQPGRQRRAS